MSYGYYMDYIPFDINNPHCLHVMLSNRAYLAIINETFEHGTDETGGLLMGYIIGRKWYVVDVIDPGTNNTIHQTGLFQWDQNYVNQMADRMRKLYRYQPTILGFWHRHPGSMDFFSQTDEESTQKNLRGARKGLISMLVNIDPALRMTFYYCNGPHFMPVRYDVGDEYFPVELLEYATPQEISQRHMGNQRGRAVNISYRRILPPPGVNPKLSIRADNDVIPDAEIQAGQEIGAQGTATQGTATQETTTQETATVETVTEETVTEETVTEETVTEETVTEETVTEETVSEETVTEEAVTEDTVTEEAVTEETVTEEAVTEETVTEETVSEGTVTEETVTEEAVTEETVTEETVTEETVTEETVTEEAVTEEAVTEETATEETVTEESVDQETDEDEESDEDQESDEDEESNEDE